MATDGTTAPAANTPPQADPPIQWDGDRMFNIYIYDYCLKRGFHKTAHELMVEAQIPPQSQPPINAKQGLLFEWWSVFWVLFTAKSNGHGPEEAILYTQHQAALQNAAQKQQRNAAQPGQQPQSLRYPNGVRPPGQPGPQLNGVGPPVPPPGGPLPNGTQSAVPFPGNMTQANGVPGTSAGPPAGVAPPQGQNMPQGMPGQRPVAPQQQQRGPNGVPFQSPTMAHSPPNAPNAPGTSQPMSGLGPVGANPPLTQMNRGNMLPPNGPQGPMSSTQQTPQPAYQQLVGRSSSNPGSPAQNNLMHPNPSPSMSHRQPPGMVAPSHEMVEQELNRMPPHVLQKLKQDLNIPDKDVTALSPQEKQQLVQRWRMTKPPNMAGPSNMQGGQPGPPMQPPSGLRNAQMPPQGQPGQPPHQSPHPGHNQPQRGAKRNSTSPGQEPEQLPTRNDSSPPDRKRLRRSPATGEQQQQQQQMQQPPMTPMYPPPQPPQQQHGGPPMQHMGPNGMMRGQMQMQPFPGQPMPGMNSTMLGHGLGTPQMSPMNPPMAPGMMGAPAQGGMNPQIHQYRQAMQTIHKQPHLQQMLPGGVPSPSASDAQGGGMPGGHPPGPGNRQPQAKPMTGMMPPPPPSPAMSAKTPGGPAKQDDGGPPPNGRIDASPQNAAAGIGGQGPGQPGGPGGPGGPGPTAASTPAPPTPTASAMTAPSPSAILNASTPNMSNHPPPPPPPAPATDGLDPNPFGIDFAAGLGDFDPNMFNGDSSLNFERDFAAWFDPENA